MYSGILNNGLSHKIALWPLQHERSASCRVRLKSYMSAQQLIGVYYSPKNYWICHYSLKKGIKMKYLALSRFLRLVRSLEHLINLPDVWPVTLQLTHKPYRPNKNLSTHPNSWKSFWSTHVTFLWQLTQFLDNSPKYLSHTCNVTRYLIFFIRWVFIIKTIRSVKLIKSFITTESIFLTTAFSQRVFHNVFLITSFSQRLSHYVFLTTSFSLRLSHNVFLTTSFSLRLSHYVFLTTSFPQRHFPNIFVLTT